MQELKTVFAPRTSQTANKTHKILSNASDSGGVLVVVKAVLESQMILFRKANFGCGLNG